jgi:hypothetical protein
MKPWKYNEKKGRCSDNNVVYNHRGCCHAVGLQSLYGDTPCDNDSTSKTLGLIRNDVSDHKFNNNIETSYSLHKSWEARKIRRNLRTVGLCLLFGRHD